MWEDIIRRRLLRLEESLKRLESKKRIPKKKFIRDWEVQDIVLREFEVAIESCLDISQQSQKT